MPKATILIVDDEQLIRWSLVARLSEEGYRTIEAETGLEAMSRYRSGADLVLLDYQLGDTDGLSVLKEMREYDPGALIVLLTGHSCVDTAVEAMKQGAYHYATKPLISGSVQLTRCGCTPPTATPTGISIMSGPSRRSCAWEPRPAFRTKK